MAKLQTIKDDFERIDNYEKPANRDPDPFFNLKEYWKIRLSPEYYHKYYPEDSTLRDFKTGATRSNDSERYDPEGFLSPLVIERFCQYMHKHRKQEDGSVRASDNWQKGMPKETYIKGMWRHFLHAWLRHRDYGVDDPKAADNLAEDLCAIIFNAQGYLHTLLENEAQPGDNDYPNHYWYAYSAFIDPAAAVKGKK